MKHHTYLNSLYQFAISRQTGLSPIRVGAIIKIDNYVSTRNYTIVTTDTENVENTNYIQNLENGVYVVRKVYENAYIEEQIISKQ